MQTKFGIRRNFARRAGTYDAHAQVQRYMAAELLGLSAEAVRQARRILEVGCGTGYLTRELRRLNAQALLVAVDLDPALLQAARQKLNGDTRTAWLAADGEAITRGRFDLIISNSAFQWFSQPAETLANYARCLTPGGRLAFTAVGPGTFPELRRSLEQAAAELKTAGPDLAAARFPGDSDWQRLLEQAGFAHIRVQRHTLTVYFPSPQAFLKSLQATGATNPVPRPLSPRLFRAMLTAYHARFALNGAIPATYELIWAEARK
ncbi:MAG: malonyl-ACP O-methyltransferase BioC [Deltaproteobacteria bacterium]|nr:malonyl-ACP O-methyltransferase BioC [Deltaproteobacteria bacterium]